MQRVVVSAFVVALATCAFCASGAQADTRSRRVAANDPTPSIQVRYATSEGAYISRGLAHGLKVGDTLADSSGKPACKIVRIADHSALCATKTAKAGDELVLPRFKPRVVPRPKTRKPRPVTTSLVRLRSRRFHTAKFEKVPFDGESRPASGLAATEVRGQYRFQHPVWSARSRVFQSETLYLNVHGNDLGVPGLRMDASATARYWSQRPEGVRFRATEPGQLDVWQLSVTYRDPGKNLSAAAGRLRPRFVPGVPIIDGAQAGWRLKGRSEVGVFGGLLPSIATTDIRNDYWVVGGYAVYEQPIGEEVMLRHTARVSQASLAGESVSGAELDTRARLSRRTQAGGAVAIQTGSGDVPLVERWSLEASSTIGSRLRVRGGARYLDSRHASLWGASSLFPGGVTRRADVGVSVRVVSGLLVDVNAGQLDEVQSKTLRQYVGPTVHLSRWLPPRTRLSIGYAEELGTQAAHTGYIAVRTRPWERWRIHARAGAAVGQDAFSSSSFASVQTDFRLRERLTASASLMSYAGRVVLLESTGLRTQAGLSGQLAISGSF